MRRGEVWWANLPPPMGPTVVLLSRDQAYAVRSQIVVAKVTSRIRGIPAEVTLGAEDGLSTTCAANLDKIDTIPKSALQRRIGMLTPEHLRAVEAAIHFALGLEA